MMKQITLLLLTSLFLWSCGNSLTEVWINKNTSGKVKMSMDMGEAIDMVGSMLQELDSEKENKQFDEDEKSFFGEGKFDSTLVMFDMAPDSIKLKMTRPELLKNMVITMKGDADKKEMNLAVKIVYENEEELEDFLTEFASLQEQNPGGGMSREDFKKTFANQQVDYKNGIVRIPRNNALSDLEDQGLLDELTRSQLDSLQYLGEDIEGLGFLKEILNTDFKVKYYLPGKVEFTNDRNAIIEDNTVTFSDNLWEALLNGEEIEVQDRIIKYTSK